MGLMKLITKGLRIEKRDKTNQVVTDPPPDMYYSQSEHLNNNPAFATQAANNFHNAIQGQALGNRNILVITPTTNADVARIVENLQKDEACVINLEPIPVADAQRRFDFLSGVICAIDGSIQPLDAHKYILTPRGMGVRQGQ